MSKGAWRYRDLLQYPCQGKRRQALLGSHRPRNTLVSNAASACPTLAEGSRPGSLLKSFTWTSEPCLRKALCRQAFRNPSKSSDEPKKVSRHPTCRSGSLACALSYRQLKPTQDQCPVNVKTMGCGKLTLGGRTPKLRQVGRFTPPPDAATATTARTLRCY